MEKLLMFLIVAIISVVAVIAIVITLYRIDDYFTYMEKDIELKKGESNV